MAQHVLPLNDQGLISDVNPLCELLAQELADKNITMQFDGLTTDAPSTHNEEPLARVVVTRGHDEHGVTSSTVSPADEPAQLLDAPAGWRGQRTGLSFILEDDFLRSSTAPVDEYVVASVKHIVTSFRAFVDAHDDAQEHETARVVCRQMHDPVARVLRISFGITFDQD